MLIIFIIIPCNLFFLFISRKPISWPANNCHQIMVCLCAMSSTCVWLQKIFSVLRWFLSEKRQIALLSEDIHKKQRNKLGDRMIKQLLKLGYRKISWFVSGEQINYLPKPKAEANNWPARHWQITIFCDNRVLIIFNYSFILTSANTSWFSL